MLFWIFVRQHCSDSKRQSRPFWSRHVCPGWGHSPVHGLRCNMVYNCGQVNAIHNQSVMQNGWGHSFVHGLQSWSGKCCPQLVCHVKWTDNQEVECAFNYQASVHLLFDLQYMPVDGPALLLMTCCQASLQTTHAPSQALSHHCICILEALSMLYH